MFERLLAQINSEFARRLFRIQMNNPQQQVKISSMNHEPITNNQKNPPDFLSAMQGLQKSGVQNTHKALGRNDPCHCGSGKKYKRCHFPN